MVNKTRKRLFGKTFHKITKIPYNGHLKVLDTRDWSFVYQGFFTIHDRTGAIFTALIVLAQSYKTAVKEG